MSFALSICFWLFVINKLFVSFSVINEPSMAVIIGVKGSFVITSKSDDWTNFASN